MRPLVSTLGGPTHEPGNIARGGEMAKGSHSRPGPPVGSEMPERLFEAVARAASAVVCQLDVARLVDAIIEQTRLLGAAVVAVFGADLERRELSLLGQLGIPP